MSGFSIRTLSLLLALAASPIFAIAQSTYEVSPGSYGNQVELDLENSAAGDINGTLVRVTSEPSWIHVRVRELDVERIPAAGSLVCSFPFDVDPEVPPGTEGTLQFTIIPSGSPPVRHEIRIRMAAPTSFTLGQNFPNPFNPSTTITFELTASADIHLSVFDVAGREVAVLQQGQTPAGRHTVVWSAASVASGIYFYRMVAHATDGTGRVFSDSRKMVLLK